jgi:hypothetical protein
VNTEYQQAFDTLFNTWRSIFAREIESALLGGALQMATPKTRERVVNGLRVKGEKRSPGSLAKLTADLGAYIKKNPGQRIEQIGKAMGVATKDLALPVKKLIAEKAIRTRGQKRATAYFAGSKVAS